ncbi:hypothetical protein C0992_009088 [Termitomyces sp. T32_za158]|nr:hypothetical protein C0992_009088 [Termitomyces sp. T32_za158]
MSSDSNYSPTPSATPLGKRRQRTFSSSDDPPKQSAPKFMPSLISTPRPSALQAVQQNFELYQKGGPLCSQGTQDWEQGIGLVNAGSPIQEVNSPIQSKSKIQCQAEGRKDLSLDSESSVETKVDDVPKRLTPAHLELIQDYNRLRAAFREGEAEREAMAEEHEEMSTKILLLKEHLRRLHRSLVRSRQFSTLIGKQLVMHGQLHQPGDISDMEE